MLWHTSPVLRFAVRKIHSIYIMVMRKTFVESVTELAPAVLSFSKYPQDLKIANAQICKEWWAILRVMLDLIPSIKEMRAVHSVESLLNTTENSGLYNFLLARVTGVVVCVALFCCLCQQQLNLRASFCRKSPSSYWVGVHIICMLRR